ncbi:translocation/assembly module TamB domain-containing protein [Tabrizicola sp.]|uniref:translocation/assembly module TamB domain-containing protein n=1 Tax=Tabrizicola sp. TaxID=2005166 RepID=UPI0026097FDE|nr:translocation/assembly module TamB domain-containing protein [Tabrizicola sp.]MDM7931629.1 translocation/assembly module TamB domain-containing protein [Tabrizicola sp.]
MRRVLLLAAALAVGPAHAQDSDQGFLAAFLEDSLSDAGRQVTITGFAGALSARATIETLTIADDTGIWLTVEGVTLDWSRSSLLSGALEVSELSAASITMSRLPDTGDSSLPSPEASSFSLPELPVSIDVGRIAAGQIVLGEGVLGQPVTGSLEATLRLAEGAGRATLDLIRSGEGPEGEIILDAAYDNTSRNLDLSLTAGEGAGGVVASLLGIPGAPATEFRLEGTGPVEAFAADISLATDGEDRLSGKITLIGEAGADYRLQAAVAGNLAPLLVPEHVDFFGTNVSLTLDAQRSAIGRVTVNRFSVQAQSLALDGAAVLAADGLPEEISVSGSLAAPDGSALLLPFGDTPTRIDRAEFQLDADLATGMGWRASALVQGLDREEFQAARLSLTGSGRIGRTPAGNSLGGTLALDATGLLPKDAALSAALGPSLAGGLKLHFLQGGGAVSLSDMRLDGEGFSGGGALRIEGLVTGLRTTGRLAITAEDLSRFSLLAGRPLGGSGTISLNGSATGLSGFLDGTAEVTGEDLQVGVDQIDRLMLGQSRAALSVFRDETGTTIRSFDLAAGTLSATGEGRLTSAGSDLRASVTLSDLSGLDPGFAGSAGIEAEFSGTADLAGLQITGTANRLQLGNPTVDSLLAGESGLSADLQLADGRLRITSARLANPQLEISAEGELAETTRRLVIEARLANLGLLISDLQGPLTVAGQATEDASGYEIDLAGRGPGQVNGQITGRIAANLASADLVISGTGQAGLANLFIAPRAVDGPIRYDLRLVGPFQTSSLSGRVTLSSGRLSDPALGFALEGIEALADVQGGQARLSATAGLSTGGMVRADGSIGLSPPFPSDLSVNFDRVRLFDPELYETTVGGNIRVSGPLVGGATVNGALLLSETELRVPESGFGSAETLLEVTHLNEPAAVRATRVRAGLLDGPGSAAGAPRATAPFGLDLTISAPSRIFLRGRGIDAELGGTIRLTGTSAQIVPAGAFNLIRGRMDILGKRLVLAEANLQLEGSFVPILQVSASNASDGIVSFVTIAGPADDPEVSFTSVPALPQEEVLARLLFGRGFDNISALQAAQLANAVATLAGRGGAGLVNRLRQSFGLDDLDLTTAEDGSTALTAGKYIARNVYTEVEIEQGGKSRINLNLDLRPGVTVKGRVGADGETGIGVFIERDY